MGLSERRHGTFPAGQIGRLFGRPVDLVVESAIKKPYFLQSEEQTRTRIYEA